MGPLKKIGAARGSGTTMFFRPDEKIFPDVGFDAKRIAELLEAKAYLHGGLTVEFVDERAGTKSVHRSPTISSARAMEQFWPS